VDLARTCAAPRRHGGVELASILAFVPAAAKFTTDDFVDAAVRLVVAGGPGAATASAVAAAVGAPSGSVYHRFATRSDLLATTWLRSARRFHHAFLPTLTGADPVAAAVDAARQVVRWCLRNRDAATLLARYGRDDFVAADCSPAVLAEAEASDTVLREALAAFLARFPTADHDRVLLAVVDGPLALVRRRLRTSGLGKDTVETAADVARRLLAPGGRRSGR